MSYARSPRPVVSITVGTTKLDVMLIHLLISLIHFFVVQSSNSLKNFFLASPCPILERHNRWSSGHRLHVIHFPLSFDLVFQPVASPERLTHSIGQYQVHPSPWYPQSLRGIPNEQVRQATVHTPLAHVNYLEHFLDLVTHCPFETTL